MQHDLVVSAGERGHLLDRETVRGRVDQATSGTSAAGWASQVGYQNDRISRRAW